METPSSNVFPPISRASVKVMRSHDYCHFEVVLGTENDVMADITPAQVDNLRKEAARLADKAVEQYKIAKNEAQKRSNRSWDRQALKDRVEALRSGKADETEWTPEDKAIAKVADDEAYWANRGLYDYQDDFSPMPDPSHPDEVPF